MKLSAIVKKEIAVDPEEKCCRQAMLSAVIHTGGTVSFSREGIKIFVGGGCLVAEALKDLFTALYGGGVKLEKSKAVIEGDSVRGALISLGIFKTSGEIESGIGGMLARGECCKKAYLAGAFLGCGSVVLPKSGYSLELLCESEALRDDLIKLFAHFNIVAGTAEKDFKYKLYIKDGQTVSDSLALMGASKGMLQLNALIAERELKQVTARLSNCDLANLDRTVEVSVKQCEAAAGLKRKGLLVDKKLADVADARLKNPEASYEELGRLMGISKGAVKYRLGRVVSLWDNKEK